MPDKAHPILDRIQAIRYARGTYYDLLDVTTALRLELRLKDIGSHGDVHANFGGA